VVLWVTDEEDTFHSGEGIAGQLRQGIGRGRSALRVALKNKTRVRVR